VGGVGAGVYLWFGKSIGGTNMPLYEPTELRYWDESKAYNGYTMLGARFPSGGVTFLLDMKGNVAHSWQAGGSLLDNGNLLSATRGEAGERPGFRELDWEGNTVWECTEKRENYAPHHAYRRNFNKKLNAPTTMYIANKSVSHDEAIAAGCNPANVPDEGGQMDAIVEIDMDGNVVWEWWFFDHVVQDFDSSKPNYVGKGKTFADYPGRLDLNLPGRPLRRDWLHCNSVDYNQELDQVVINSVQGEFCVIDHGNTFIPGDPEGSIALAAGPAGDFMYRFGDPARYEQGEPPSMLEDWNEVTTGHKQIGGSHNVQWIRPGLPGAGHFLLFNNGQYLSERTPQSYIFEINAFLDADRNDTGNYVNPPDAGYYTWGSPEDYRNTHKHPKETSNQIIWIYHAQRNTAFFSHTGSGCQRLPNGNTMICAVTEGDIFEVTSEGEVVWEYINPVTIEGEVLKIMPDRCPRINAVGGGRRYAPDHPALAGRDLIPKGTITEIYGSVK